MSMIRSAIGTDPEVLRHHPLAQRVAGAECRDQFSRPFSSRKNYFLLTFPLIELQGGPISLGPRTISLAHPPVNMSADKEKGPVVQFGLNRSPAIFTILSTSRL